jgi:hypothetical protein
LRNSTQGIVSRNSVLALAACVALASAVAFAATSDKVLENVKGVVRYQSAGAAARDLAPSGSVAVNDRDTLSTGGASLGELVLPDSSIVMLGQNTRVQVSGFNEAGTTTASFVVYDGKTRFDVRHPAGAKANYTFKTPVGEISVRGTLGDISVDAQDGMRLNVYGTHNAGAPVAVTLDTIYGEHFDLHAGEKVWVRWQNGKLVGRKTVLSQAEIDRFAEFGPPGGAPPK